MALTEKIRVLFEVDDKGSFGKFRTSIAQADGATGKFKAGLSSLGGALKANAAEAAVAAGAALVAFGTASVKAFQETALESGKAADAIGISVEEASRLKEVAGDLGVDLGTVQGAMQKMNKAAADGVIDVEGFGNAVVKTSDGTVDSYQSFINAATAIGAIEDPAKRAKAAQETFGKSYGEIAELMEMDAKSLRKALDGVSNAKVIDDEDLRNAREFRDAIDQLKGKFEDLQNEVGGALVPVLTDFIGQLEAIDATMRALPFVDGIGDIIKWGGELQKLFSPFDELKGVIDLFGGETLELGENMAKLAIDQLAAEKAAKELATTTSVLATDFADLDKKAYLAEDAIRDAEDATRGLDDAYGTLIGTLDQQDAWANVQTAMWNYHADIDVTEQETRDYTRALGEMVLGLEGVPEETKANLITQLQEGDIATVEAYLQTWALGVNVPVRFVGQGNVGFMKNARGTPPGGSPGGLTLVGEEGPELVNMPRGAHVTPAGETARLMSGGGGSGVGGGGVTNIYTAANPNAVIAAIKQYERMNGTGWRR